MKSLLMMRPLAATITSGGSVEGAARLADPDPREAAFQTANTTAAYLIDLGSPQVVDTVFVGYNSFSSTASLTEVASSVSGTFGDGIVLYSQGATGYGLSVAPLASNPRKRHGYISFAPVVARYVRVQIATVDAASIGVLACGRSFVARWGHEYGSGRPITDTSSVERLFGGGFSIDEGAIVSGYQWTFGDLQNLETQRLFRLAMSIGQSKTVLVIEDPDFLTHETLIAGNNVTLDNSPAAGATITKTSGAASTYDSFAFAPPIQGGLLATATYSLNNSKMIGLSETPGLADGVASIAYGIEQKGNEIFLYTNGAFNRFIAYSYGLPTVVYDEAGFSAYAGSALIDTTPAAPGRVLGARFAIADPTDSYTAARVVPLALHPDERIHWGILQKLEPYERLNPLDTKWSFQIGDWA